MDRAFSPLLAFFKMENKLRPPQGPFSLGLRGWGDFDVFENLPAELRANAS